MKEFLYKVKPFIKVVSIILGVIIIGVLAVIYKLENDGSDDPVEIVSTITSVEEVKEDEKKIEEVTYIYVDVKGAVKKPGVYKLEEGSRVIDAINKSGGLNKDANTSVLNLSKKLEDGNVIIVYTSSYIEERQKQEIVIEYIEKDCACPDNNNDACVDNDEVIIENPENNELNQEPSNKKVSLNNATLEELLTLPGIGESKALDILDYVKENGGFKTIEEIKEVKGIGNALFEKIKELITI